MTNCREILRLRSLGLNHSQIVHIPLSECGSTAEVVQAFRTR